MAKSGLVECFSAFFGFEVPVHVLVNRLAQNDRPDQVKADVLLGVIYHRRDSVLSSKGAWTEKLLNIIFPMSKALPITLTTCDFI